MTVTPAAPRLRTARPDRSFATLAVASRSASATSRTSWAWARGRTSACPRVAGSFPDTMRQNRQSSMLPVLHMRRYPLAVPDVTVSIIAGADAGLLHGCLDSLAGAARTTGIETIVVDNASPDPIAARPGVEVIRNEFRRGFGANHNAALERAGGRYALILNDDTVLDPGAIDRLRAFMDQNPVVGVAGPRLRYPGGGIQPSAFHFPTPARVALTALTLQRLGWDMSRGESIRRVDWVHGAAMMVRMDAFREAGGLDERFYMYLEDVDVCRRLRERGWEVAFFPRAAIVHYENSSTAGVPE